MVFLYCLEQDVTQVKVREGWGFCRLAQIQIILSKLLRQDTWLKVEQEVLDLDSLRLFWLLLLIKFLDLLMSLTIKVSKHRSFTLVLFQNLHYLYRRIRPRRKLLRFLKITKLDYRFRGILCVFKESCTILKLIFIVYNTVNFRHNKALSVRCLLELTG